MALQVTSSSSNIGGSMGQFMTSCCIITSTNSMTGLPVNVNPALFANSPTQSPLSNSNQWINNYPSTPGIYPLNYVGGNTNKNHNITLEVIDDKNARICIDFFLLTNLNGYISDTAYNNYNIFDTVPSGYLNLFIEVGNESVICSNEVQINSFCAEPEIDFNIEGFCPGEDMDISIIANTPSGISNNFYAGFIKVNGIGNNTPYPEDYNLSYGLVSGGVSQVSDLDVSCLKSGNGFISNGNESVAQTTIDGSCLTAGSKYRFYVVYQKNGEWFSCLSDLICQKVDANLPDLTNGVISCCIKDATGVRYNDCCLKNIAPCGSLEVCFKVNRAAIENAFNSVGLTGTLESYLSSCEIYESNTEIVSGLPTSPVKAITSEGLEFCSSIGVELNVGKKYYIGCIEFNYSKSTNAIDEVIQRIYIPLEVEFSECIESEPNFVLEQDGVDPDLVEDCFCCGLEGVLSSDIGDNCFGFISKNGGSYIAYGDTSQINVSDLECDQRYCVKSICSGEPVIVDPCPCPKPCLGLSFNFSIGSIDTTNNTANVLFTASSASGQISLSETNLNISNSANSNTINLLIPFPTPLGGVYDFVAEFIAEDTCVYTKVYQITEQEIINGDYNDVTGIIAGEGNSNDCECDEVECGNNLAWVESECIDGVLTYSIQEDFEDTVVSVEEDIQETFDSDGNLIEVTIYRKYIFGEGCPYVIIEQVLTCGNDNVCINNRTLVIEVNEQCELVITANDNITSPIATDTLYIQINGNTQSISNPTFPQTIPLSNNDIYDVWSTVTFSDGCSEITTPNNPKTATCACNFTPCTFTCEADQENCLITWELVCPDGVTGTVTICIDGKEFQLQGTSGEIPFVGLAAFEITSSVDGCPPIIDSAFCLIKPTVVSGPECSEFGPIECEAKIMSVTLISGTGVGYSYQWCAPDGSQLGTGLSQDATVDGIYTLKITAPEGCPAIEDKTYLFEGGDAGTGGSTTVIKP